jgi:alpha-ketoglutarate-dependent taurine dioxygenase
MRTASALLPNVAGLRKARKLANAELVRTQRLLPNTDLPLALLPAVEDLDLISWAGTHREFVQSLLLRHGGLLFRNFRISSPAEFQQFVTAVSGEPLAYKEQTSPRSRVEGNIYTSTEYPPEHIIFLHNENSYSSAWPLKIMFFCVTAPQEAGETPIADVRRVFARIPENVRDRFAHDGWMLVRNFGTGYGLPWQTAFQTEDKEEVDRHCRANGIQTEWLSGNRLRIRQRRIAIRKHPVTGEAVWFNHATFFHISTLAPEIRAELQAELAEEDFPYNTYYGDGSRIEPEVLDILRDAYQQETIKFSWQEHDLLLLDNMLAAHGRSAFRGPRKIIVGMTEPYSGDRENSL